MSSIHLLTNMMEPERYALRPMMLTKRQKYEKYDVRPKEKPAKNRFLVGFLFQVVLGRIELRFISVSYGF